MQSLLCTSPWILCNSTDNCKLYVSILNAAGQTFYTGTSGPATYCPTNVGAQCPQVAGTLVTQDFEAMAVSSLLTQCFFLLAAPLHLLLLYHCMPNPCPQP